MAHSARNVGRALVWSLLAHGALVAGLCLVRGPVPRKATDLGFVDTGPALSLSLDDSPGPKPTVLPTGAEEQQVHEEDFHVAVRESAPTPAATTPETAPVVVGAPPKARGAGGAATGTAAGIASGTGRRSLLEAPPTARTVVYLLDRSLSMGPNGALTRARHEVLASLAQLSVRTSFQVIVYNRQPLAVRVDGRSGFHVPDDATRAAVARELDHIAAAGNTDHVGALRMGLLLRPDVLFLVTDAADLTDREVRAVTALNAGRTVINTVELSGARDDDGPLRRLATLNGGSHRHARPAE